MTNLVFNPQIDSQMIIDTINNKSKAIDKFCGLPTIVNNRLKITETQLAYVILLMDTVDPEIKAVKRKASKFLVSKCFHFTVNQ